MSGMKRKESGASEVIGAVLLVSLVVIGGAVVAAMVFGQPTPKEVPAVSFGVNYSVYEDDPSMGLLTLHHTGGDSLLDEKYRVYVFDNNYDRQDVTSHIFEEDKNWSSGSPMRIRDVPSTMKRVTLAYRDGAGGETVLRNVDFEDFGQTPPNVNTGPWTISGYKRNVTSSGQLIGPLKNVTIRLTNPQGDIDFPSDGMVNVTDDDGYFSFSVPDHQATYRLAEEDINLTLWKPYSPASGQYDSITLTHHQTSVVRNFSNERLPPPPWKISGHKWNVTWQGIPIGENPGLAGVVINLTLMSGDAPGFPSQGKIATTNDTGYYEFEVPGYWEFEVPAVLPTYRLTEEIDRAVWRPFDPLSGVREGVRPGATDQDFSNWKLVPDKKISGYKWGYSPTGWRMGPVKGIQIDLTHTSGEFPDVQSGEFPDAQIGRTITDYTDENGYYEFIVSGFPALYTVKETNVPANWTPWIPSTGSFENVPPGATRDFANMLVPMGGKVIRLEKTEQINTATEGYLVGGSFFQVEAGGKDWVTIGGKKYEFEDKSVWGNNPEIRFVINGDQNRGRMTVTKGGTDLVEFSFNVTMQKKVGDDWVDVEGASGLISDISITNINKNGIVMGSNLTYRHPSYESWTMLRLDGETVIPSVVDQTPFEFTNLHIVHDNSQHEGNNIMWIWLEPGNNSLLVEGDYVDYPGISPSSDP